MDGQPLNHKLLIMANRSLFRRFYVETHMMGRDKGGGRQHRGEQIYVHILELLRRAMECSCFGVDCCKGIMKIPTVDGSELYLWGEAGAPVWGTYKEACDASDAAKAKGLKADSGDCGGGC